MPSISPGRTAPVSAGLPLRAAVAAAAWLLSVPVAASTQETQSPISPAGRLRIDLAPTFTSWNTRFGPGGTEPLGVDLPTNLSELPGLPDLEAAVRAALDDPSFEADPGTFRAAVSADQARIPLRLDLGVTDWLTIGTTVPFVKSRTEIEVSVEGGGGLGINPGVTDPEAVQAFLVALQGARAAAEDAASAACVDPETPACLNATAAREDVVSLLALAPAYAASVYFPSGTSAAGEALTARFDSANSHLEAAGLTALGAPLPLPSAGLASGAAVDSLVTSTGTGWVLPGFANREGLWELGDVEVHAVVRLLDGAVRDSAAGPARARWQVGAAGLVRLPTGQVDDPNVPYDLGSGDGQTDVEGRVFADVTVGRFGLWADGRYGVQMSTTLTRRVAPPELVLAPAVSLAEVEWTPGSYVRLDLAPRYHLTEALAVTAGYSLYHKAEDEYARVSPLLDPPPALPWGLPAPTDVGLLALETEETVHSAGIGLVFSTLAMWREGRTSIPLEARFIVRDAVSGSGGRTPNAFRTEIGLRVYQRLWGG